MKFDYTYTPIELTDDIKEVLELGEYIFREHSAWYFSPVREYRIKFSWIWIVNAAKMYPALGAWCVICNRPEN